MLSNSIQVQKQDVPNIVARRLQKQGKLEVEDEATTNGAPNKTIVARRRIAIRRRRINNN